MGEVNLSLTNLKPMSIFLFSLCLFISTYVVIKVDEHINWFNSYKRIAKAQKDDRKRERIYR